MPKIPYKPENPQEDEDDYEIVSFEDFCDKSPGSKTDLLTLNDNINYRLCYENDKGLKFAENEGETSSRDAKSQRETSLSDAKNASYKRKLSGPFAPFGKYNGKSQKSSLFSGVIPKPRTEGESSSREHRYQRFSGPRTTLQRICENLPSVGSGMLAIALVCALCVAAWWAVGGAIGGAWEEDHYKRLWERAHPDNVKKTLSPIPYEKSQVLPDTPFRYHDHNNLSTKNKNSTEVKKKEANKKSYDLQPEQLLESCQQLPEETRFDCAPRDPSKELCERRGCCWQETKTNSVPWCYYPPHYGSYKFLNMTENKHGMTVTYERVRHSGYPRDFNFAQFEFKYMNDDVLQIKITDPENKRFEAPYPQMPTVPGPISNMKYKVVLDSLSVGFKVVRTSDNVTIVDTQDVGGLILSDKLLQISSILPTDLVYGFGENRGRFLRDINWSTITLFNHDNPPKEGWYSYGSHPFYLAVEKTGNSHAMLLLNTNAMDIVLQPAPAVTYRTVGGILNFYIMLGPTPAETVAQYTALIGRPVLPPYWGLGFHLCKYGYHSLDTTEQVWKTNREAGLPFDVQWNDIDYMHNYNDFTVDPDKYKGLPDFVKKLHSNGMHYIILTDPGVSGSEPAGTYPPYDRGLNMDVFIKNSSGQVFVGKVWNLKSTVFPDFTHPNATTYWVEMVSEFHRKLPFDGLWLDMNEPSNFGGKPLVGECAPFEQPYVPLWIKNKENKLCADTICMDAKHHLGSHYDVHNLHGLTEIIATSFALQEVRGKRAFIISRTSFPGLGRRAGHWTGDIASSWDEMRYTIPAILNFGLFGIPLVGADICGFAEDTTVPLCKRWMQLGAFYPFSRNHNDVNAKPQDPYSLGQEVLTASIKALRIRYALLPYYYTMFFRAHVYGETVARPLFFEWPNNTKLHAIDQQFLIGPHVLISPLLHEGQDTEKAFFPGPDRWYNFLTGDYIASDKYHDVNEDEMVAVRGGAILPLQRPPLRGPVSTANTRSAPLQLLAAPGAGRRALGRLYWDDGDSIHSHEEKKYTLIDFKLDDASLESNVSWWGYGVPSLSNITILDQRPVQGVTVNGMACGPRVSCRFAYDGKHKTLQIYNLNLTLDSPFNVKWLYKSLAAKDEKHSCKGEHCSDND